MDLPGSLGLVPYHLLRGFWTSQSVSQSVRSASQSVSRPAVKLSVGSLGIPGEMAARKWRHVSSARYVVWNEWVGIVGLNLELGL